MHQSAMDNAKKFFDVFAKHKQSGLVIDIGSQDVNGTLKTAMPTRFKYIGVDFQKAQNVDVILNNPYQYPFGDQTVDMVVSSSCLEHSEFFWLSFIEMVRVTKPDGLIYLNAPSQGQYHDFPVDCWRFMSDAPKALAKYANEFYGFNTALLQAYTDPEGPWHDMVAIYCKDAKYACQYPDRIAL